MPGSSLQSLRRLALAGMFAGLAWGAGYVESVPNFEFLTVILFAGGWALGPLGGALAGALGEFLYSTINPYGSGLMHPLVLASQVAGMALAGAAGGWVGRLGLAHPRARWFAVVLAGIAVTLVFDLITNLASGAVYGQWLATLKLAIPFVLVHVGTNAALFATVGVLLTHALDRTRRSLAPRTAALLLAGALACACAGGASAQSAQPTREDIARADSAHADSVAYRDASRNARPPSWGDGPAALLRRETGSLSRALTLDGGYVERWADDRGSAEPLGRFGLAGPNRVLIDWLGLPLTGVGAVGAEPGRVPWLGVGAIDAPRLPASATEPYRGELGAVTVNAWPAVAGHPRVTGWAALGDPPTVHNGFLVSTSARPLDLFLGVEATSLGPREPLGMEGDHSIAGRLGWTEGRWAASGAYRTTQQSIEDELGLHERRGGEAGRADLTRDFGDLGATLAFERTSETLTDDGSTIGSLAVRGRGGRLSLRVDRKPGADPLHTRAAFAAVTYGRETLESEGDVAFDRRAADLWWASAGRSWTIRGAQADLALGAGTYGGGAVDVAPSLLVHRDAPGGTSGWWAGAARGITAAPDARATDALGSPLTGDPPVARSSTWLGGVGAVRRSADQAAGGSWRGGAPKGSLGARAALYVGRSDPGSDPTRFLFAGESIAGGSLVASGAATKFVALVASGTYGPWTGFTIGAGGQAIGRSVDAALTPSDPEARAHLSLEERFVIQGGAPDLRFGITGEWIGPRNGTPAGDLPAAFRLDTHASALIDEFEFVVAWRNFAGSNRLLPLTDPLTGAPAGAAGSVLRFEARWTFWD